MYNHCDCGKGEWCPQFGIAFKRATENAASVRPMVRRCDAPHPMYGRTVRCEELRGHSGEHFHSFYMRSWPQNSAPAFAFAR